MRNRIKLIMIMTCLCTSFARADWGPTLEKPAHHYLPFSRQAMVPFITGTIGTAMTARVGQSQSFGPIDLSNYAYSANQSSQNKPIAGGTIGVELSPDDTYEVQLGISYYQSSNYSFTGSVTQGVDAASLNTYTYAYNTTSKQILANSKILFNFGELAQYHPYLSIELGESFNHTSQYTISNPIFITFSPMFGNNDNTSFSYALGLGLDLDLTSHWRMGAGYRFSDLGKADLGEGLINNTAIGYSLKQDHVYVNELIGQLTYLL